MGRTLLRVLKIICYVALGALLAGFAVLAFLGVLDICSRSAGSSFWHSISCGDGAS